MFLIITDKVYDRFSALNSSATFRTYTISTVLHAICKQPRYRGFGSSGVTPCRWICVSRRFGGT